MIRRVVRSFVSFYQMFWTKMRAHEKPNTPKSSERKRWDGLEWDGGNGCGAQNRQSKKISFRASFFATFYVASEKMKKNFFVLEYINKWIVLAPHKSLMLRLKQNSFTMPSEILFLIFAHIQRRMRKHSTSIVCVRFRRDRNTGKVIRSRAKKKHSEHKDDDELATAIRNDAILTYVFA